jgi:hypothetical protein
MKKVGMRWTPTLRPRGARIKLALDEVRSKVCCVHLSRLNPLERESDQADAPAAPSSRF